MTTTNLKRDLTITKDGKTIIIPAGKVEVSGKKTSRTNINKNLAETLKLKIEENENE